MQFKLLDLDLLYIFMSKLVQTLIYPARRLPSSPLTLRREDKVFSAWPKQLCAVRVRVTTIRETENCEWQAGNFIRPLHTYMMKQEGGIRKNPAVETCKKLTDDSLEEGELRNTDSDSATQTCGQNSRAKNKARKKDKHKHSNSNKKKDRKRKTVEEWSKAASDGTSTGSCEKILTKKKHKNKHKEKDGRHELKKRKRAESEVEEARKRSKKSSKRHSHRDVSNCSHGAKSGRSVKDKIVVIEHQKLPQPAGSSFLKYLNGCESSIYFKDSSSKDIHSIPLPDTPQPVKQKTVCRGSPVSILPSNNAMDPNALALFSQKLQALQAQAQEYAQRHAVSQPVLNNGMPSQTLQSVPQHNQLQSLVQAFRWPSLQPPLPHESVDQVVLPCAWTCEQATQYLQSTESAPGNGLPVMSNDGKIGSNRSSSSRGSAPSESRQSLRGWHTLSKEQCPGGMEFSLMSYNILSQSLMEMHPYLYDDFMDWDVRGPALCKEILAHNADVVCLQEVEEEHWKLGLQPTFEAAGYGCAYKKKTGDKVDGCAILYKMSKFELLQAVPVEFDCGGILDRDNVGLIVSLRPQRDAYSGPCRQLCVATTHLLFNPRRGDVKLAQLSLLLAEIDRLAYRQTRHDKRQGNYDPVILCGDFNSEPNSPLLQLMTSGKLQYSQHLSRLVSGQQEGLHSGRDIPVPRALMPTHLGITEGCQYRHLVVDRRRRQHPEEGSRGSLPSCAMNTGWMFHHLNLASVYTPNIGRQRAVTTHHARASCIVDYIFYTSSLAAGRGRSKQKGKKERAGQNLRSPEINKRTAAWEQDNWSRESGSRVSGAGMLSEFSRTSGTKQHPSSPSSSSRPNPSCSRPGSDMDLCTDEEGQEAEGELGPLVLMSHYSLPSGQDLNNVGAMPNKVFPSDHVCLLAKFLLR